VGESGGVAEVCGDDGSRADAARATAHRMTGSVQAAPKWFHQEGGFGKGAGWEGHGSRLMPSMPTGGLEEDDTQTSWGARFLDQKP
jgi:hypothetical protein